MTITGKCSKCSSRTSGKINGIFLCRKCQTNDDIKNRTNHLTSLDKFDLGWIAGLIEGEGCFYCKSSKSMLKDGFYCYPLPGFVLMSTDEDVMLKAALLLSLELRGPYNKKDNKNFWSLQTTGYKAEIIMKIFYNHLSKRRRKQIDEALSWKSKDKFIVC